MTIKLLCSYNNNKKEENLIKPKRETKKFKYWISIVLLCFSWVPLFLQLSRSRE